MQFAQRTNWKLMPNALTKLVEDFRQEGKPLLDLTESNPTRCGFSYPEKQILNAFTQTDNLVYTPSPRGLLNARLAVCQYYAQREISVDPQNIFLTASTSEAYSYLFRLLADPQDRILFPSPSYPLFEYLCHLNDLKMETYQLIYDQNGWRPDLEKFRLSIEENPRAVVLVNPNNPTGSFIKEGDFVVMNSLCAEKQIPIISDEVFFDYGYDFNRSYFTTLKQEEHLTFVMGGISKSLGLPQMKLSWIIAKGSQPIIQTALERLEIIADTYLSPSIPVQNALQEWFHWQQLIQKKIKERVSTNRQWLLEKVAEKGSCQYLKSEGGWYAILKLPSEIQEEDFVITLLRKSQVIVYPGYFFDFVDCPYIVVSLLPENALFQEAVTKIVQHF